MKKVKTGIVGCGNISGIYLQNCTRLFNGVLDVVSVADLIMERAVNRAKEFNVPKACNSIEELLEDKEIEIIINLTTPDAHALINMKALNAGRSVHVEKPLSIKREDGQKAVDLAKEKGLRLGGAPDTFMGAGIQTCIKLINDGWIGKPIAATGFMLCHGHESWHPDPEFYYQTGGGPMFDMGPYYITALVALMGPVKKVSGITAKTFAERTITSQPKYGKKIEVEVPTHVAGLMEFENGAVATLVTSFDVWSAQVPRIEVYGTEGSISVPDPNTFGGPVYVKRHNNQDWTNVALTHGYSENSRGLAVADMAYSIRSGRKHRANGDLANHVLDIMHGFHDSANAGKHYEIKNKCERPAPMKMDLLPGTLDE